MLIESSIQNGYVTPREKHPVLFFFWWFGDGTQRWIGDGGKDGWDWRKTSWSYKDSSREREEAGQGWGALPWWCYVSLLLGERMKPPSPSSMSNEPEPYRQQTEKRRTIKAMTLTASFFFFNRSPSRIPSHWAQAPVGSRPDPQALPHAPVRSQHRRC